MTDDNDDDKVFANLKTERERERALAIVDELRLTFVRYVAQIGPDSAKEKLQAVLDAQPELHPAAALITAQTYVVADAVMTALAAHLARAESSD